MVNGFENETHELTQEELDLVLPFKKGLINKIGVENAIKNQQMIAGFKKQGITLNEARVRKIIHYIRVKRLVPNLIATSKGYYIEKDKAKLAIYVESLDQRIRSIKEVRNSYNV